MKPGAADTFARRPIQGAGAVAANAAPDQLLLDGQQRMTSLYQICLRREVVQTVTPRLKLVKRWLYIDIQKAMNPAEDRENAIVSVPEDRRIKSDFNRKIDLDLSTPELEYQNLMFPLNQVFDWDEWQDGFNEYWLTKDPETRKLFKPFKDEILQNFKAYQLPVIALGPDTSREAVCLVFEKVNTGGKPLDAFELVTAMYASRGHRLPRLSAAYKGIHALLMAEGAIDFRSGQPFGQTVFFDEYVDIHHIFPQDWCKTQQIGYARVSKTDGSQSLDRQRDALQAAGVDAGHVYHDFASGVRDDRPGLDSCVRALRTGDVLVVWKLDRLGRTLVHLVNTVQDLSTRGVGLRVLTGQGAQIDTTAAGRLVFGIFAAPSVPT